MRILKIYINLISCFFIFNFVQAFHTEECLLNLFNEESIKTEYTAYKLLKEKPLSCKTNYLAIPWSVLINKQSLDKIPSLSLNGGFTICQHVYYEKIIPCLKKIGINTLFTPHVSNKKNHQGIRVLPFPHLSVHGADPQKKDIFYSFVGFDTHPVRKVIFKFTPQSNVIIKQRQQWHFLNNATNQNKMAQEYKNTLARSRFSLCPRGVGPSTLRFWESIQAGAIPVLISDEMQLPEGINWKKCVIRVLEKDVDKIPSILKSISYDQEKIMRQNCFRAYKLFSGKNFVSVIRKFYKG